MIALIDYGAGNLQSVLNALKAAGADGVSVTADPHVVARAERVVLPGVGAFAHCMDALSAADGLLEALHERVIDRGRPFLGICVGMQLMAREGQEDGTTPGLGWLDGVVAPVPLAPGIKVPHMGWNDVVPMGPHAVIAAGEAYFLHGYAYSGADVVATTEHGETLTAAIARDNMVGVQFHPEKSQRFGIETLARFLAWHP